MSEELVGLTKNQLSAIEYRLMELEQDLKQSNKQLEDANKVIEFYAPKENGSWEIGKIENDCGKKARQYLEKYKQEGSE